jgi:DNA-binding NtrC family response regulator
MVKNNFEIVSASSAEDAISILQEDPELNIVISDWVMPGMDGVELVQYVNDIYPDKICYMISSSNEIDKLKHYEEQGIIKKYFPKPVNVNLLLNEMDAQNHENRIIQNLFNI